MLDSADSRTIAGLPPDASPSPEVPPAAPAASAAPATDAAKERKRKTDREAQQRSRARRKAAPAKDAPPVTVAAPAAVTVMPPALEQLLPSLAAMAGGLLDEGRLVLFAQLRSPISGKVLAAEVGANADALLAYYGVTLTPEAVVWCNLAMSLATAGAVVAKLPAMSAAQATAAAPSIQAALDGKVTGESH